MYQNTRMVLLLLCLLGGVAQGRPFAEKVIPLHAPLAGIAPDGVTAYSNLASIYIGEPLNFIELFDTYNITNKKFKTISVGNKKYTQKQYNDAKLKLLDDTNPVNLTFFLSDPRITGRRFLENPDADFELAKHFSGADEAYKTIPSKKFFYTGDLCELGILDPKKLKYIVKFEPCYMSGAPGEEGSDAVINNNRIIFTMFSDVKVYKIDFSHLPKTIEELNKNIIYSNTIKNNVDPFDKKLNTYTGASGSLSMSPDGTLAASGISYNERENNAIPNIYGWVRSMETGRLKYVIKDQTEGINKTAFSYNNHYLATRGNDSRNVDASYIYQIYLRNGSNGKTIKIYNDVLSGPFFSKDNKMLYSDSKFNLHIISLP